MTEAYKKLLIDLAQGRRLTTPVELGDKGIQAGLPESIYTKFPGTENRVAMPAVVVMRWLFEAVEFDPEPLGGFYCYRIAHDSTYHFVYADRWYETFVAIRFARMAALSPTLRLLFEAAQKLEPEQQNLLLSAPTSECFPLTGLLETFSIKGEGVMEEFSAAIGGRRFKASIRQICLSTLSVSHEVDWSKESGLTIGPLGKTHTFRLSGNLLDLILAAISWRELHMPT